MRFKLLYLLVRPSTKMHKMPCWLRLQSNNNDLYTFIELYLITELYRLSIRICSLK